MFDSRIFASLPLLEVLAKNIYWRTPEQFMKVATRLRRHFSLAREQSADPIDFPAILDALRRAGVKPGGILVLHTSMDLFVRLGKQGIKASDMLAGFRALLGSDGTLAVPAFPLIKGDPTGRERMNDAHVSRLRLTYDVRRSPSWTSALPREMQRLAGARRSRHPLNPLAAIGPHADAMMAGDLQGDAPSPCGPSSPWMFCYQHDAQIVALDVDFTHSLTMIHLAEDGFPDEWPVQNWYRFRSYRVVDGDWTSDITVRERRPYWSNFFTEHRLKRDLIRDGIAREHAIGGTFFTVCKSRALVDYLRSRNHLGWPYLIPFARWRGYPQRALSPNSSASDTASAR